jgi:hypothetical protein
MSQLLNRMEIRINLRATAEIVAPSSITEHTTNLLENNSVE